MKWNWIDRNLFEIRIRIVEMGNWIIFCFCEQRKKKCRKRREEEGLYMQLSEAMECLEHICTEGCTHVGPYDVALNRERRPCSKFATCQSLQVLILHFATCKKRVNGGCLRCKRVWQLFRLHSCICQQDSCKVPLCRYRYKNPTLCLMFHAISHFLM